MILISHSNLFITARRAIEALPADGQWHHLRALAGVNVDHLAAENPLAIAKLKSGDLVVVYELQGHSARAQLGVVEEHWRERGWVFVLLGGGEKIHAYVSRAMAVDGQAKWAGQDRDGVGYIRPHLALLM